MSMKGATLLGTQDVSGTQAYVEKSEDIRSFIAGATIVKGDWVQFDATGQSAIGDVCVVIQAAVVSTGNPAAIGVAVEAGVAGKPVRVQIAGYISSCNNSASAGESLIVAGTTAGRAEAQAATDTCNANGFATADSSSNAGPCFIYRRI